MESSDHLRYHRLIFNSWGVTLDRDWDRNRIFWYSGMFNQRRNESTLVGFPLVPKNPTNIDLIFSQCFVTTDFTAYLSISLCASFAQSLLLGSNQSKVFPFFFFFYMIFSFKAIVGETSSFVVYRLCVFDLSTTGGSPALGFSCGLSRLSGLTYHVVWHVVRSILVLLR